MSDFIEKLSEELAAAVTAEVIRNVRRELTTAAKENMRICYTEKEAAKLLDCSVQTLYRKRVAGEISYSFSPKGGIVYTPAQLADFLDKTEVVRIGGTRSANKKILPFKQVA